MPCGQPSSAASIWPVALLSSSIACLPRMISCGCSSSAILARILATASGSTSSSVWTRIARSAPIASAVRKRLLRLGRADRHRDDLGRDALFLEPDRFLDRDLVERVHAHLDVGEIDARAVHLDPRLDVEIDHALDRDEQLHSFILQPVSPRAVEELSLYSGEGPGRSRYAQRSNGVRAKPAPPASLRRRSSSRRRRGRWRR